ncbi:glycoside hydrolase [Paenibacillus motobuensis]|uniref:glycoside hydrolase family 38 N-terminal domain-containing protein n=1 Tax=Paenibacillus TaxID=44249 RepID=UPI00203E34F7|nr:MULTISPECIES: glycoside hydrolase [Paenibacillus]MCM3041540.1 glycoside hydrolase [Paenibacillus lutimineralis]MCM3648644.1 glycoside hydrolase [Paenibacillus motobuensis]
MPSQKPWKIYAIHHSHTDIGYTERQEKIQQYHVNFIRQALQILREIHSGRHPEWAGFKWVCETFWPVESFMERASEQEKAEFAAAVRRGEIGLSGTYLNMSELMDKELLESMIGRIRSYGKSIEAPVTSAMTADITGFSWGYGQVLLDAGIQNLVTCIHTHHSMYPLWKKQQPFWWEMPSGERLLTWNGEHYMFGNDLGFIPGIGGSYTIKDELDTSQGVTFEIAETRIQRYIHRLEQDGYAFRFAPVMFSGLPTDNGSPNPQIIEFIQQWNAKHGEQIMIVSSTLEEFFTEVREHAASHPEDIPVHRGDWPDWWTDGVGSTPKHVQVYREAVRAYHKVKRLDPHCKIVSSDTIKDIEYHLTLFAEHTWGYHSSVTEPWNPFVQELGVRKEAFAANASTAAHRALYDILEHKGDALLSPNRPMKFKLSNPFDFVQEDFAHLIMEGWHYSLIKDGFEVRDVDSGELYPSQLRLASRGVIIIIPVTLQPGEEKTVHIQAVKSGEFRTAYCNDFVGSDRMMDLDVTSDARPFKVTSTYIDTPFVHIKWAKGDGITSWIDKRMDKEMLRQDRHHHAFTPVYDVTRAAKVEDQYEVRRKMGRNRKGPDAVTSTGILTKAEVITEGDVYGTVELTFEVAGCSHYSLFVTAYAKHPRVDVAVRIHKDSVWDPENLYISLPFGSPIISESEELWIDKMDALTRPRKDQLTGSLADYYCVGEGAAYISAHNGVAIAMPDTPLIQLGSLNHQFRLLNGDAKLQQDPAHLYAWPMNNYWETNFAATLGGFYEFRYLVAWGEKYQTPEAAIDACRSMNAGILAWRVH